MPIVTITDEQDERLVELVPRVIRGQKCAAKRTQWAIDEFLKLTGAGQPKDPEGDSKALAPS